MAMAATRVGGGPALDAAQPNALEISKPDGSKIEIKNLSPEGQEHANGISKAREVTLAEVASRIDLNKLSTDAEEQAQLSALQSFLETNASAATCTVSA